MEYIERKFMDKSDWLRGPWDHEPDKIQWVDEATGFPCLVVRNAMGSWCGYVGIGRYHRYYGVPFGQAQDIDVHGGLTFSASCSEDENGVCHVVGPNEDDHVWWLGFDHAHGYDATPAHSAFFRRYGIRDETEFYTTVDAARDEVRDLAKQLKALE